LSHSATRPRTGRRLHLYGALLECASHDGEQPNPVTAAAIWNRIDALRATGGPAEEVRLPEGLAVELHVLRQSRRERADDADPMPRVRIAALTREWLAFAPLSA
jgi:hypothetical protein